MKKGICRIERSSTLSLFLLILFAVSTGTVLAEGSTPPPDPGAGSGQDGSIATTALWVMNAPQVFAFSNAGMNYTLNWSSLDFITTNTLANGQVQFLGAGSPGEGFMFMAQEGKNTPEGGELPQNSCGDAWVTPGLISLVAYKDAPANAVVVSQDPSHYGVDMTWKVHLFPTTFNYEVWEQVPYSDDNPGDKSCKHENAECKINESNKVCCGGLICVPFNESSGNGKCRVDVNALPWGCTVKTINYPEEVVVVNPAAVLTTTSRNWIIGPLALAYPGSYLKHPAWGFQAGETCIWEGDVCVWIHHEAQVPTSDPGIYDLSVTGLTSGTAISPPRTFSLVGGQFGVYLFDNSMTISQ